MPVCLNLCFSSSVWCLSGSDLPWWGGFSWGKSYGKKKKALIVKACSILIPSLSLSAHAFYELSSFSTLKALCFSSLIIRRAGAMESQLPVHTGVRQERKPGRKRRRDGTRWRSLIGYGVSINVWMHKPAFVWKSQMAILLDKLSRTFFRPLTSLILTIFSETGPNGAGFWKCIFKIKCHYKNFSFL